MARRRNQLGPRGTGVFLLIFGIIWAFSGFMMTKQYNKNEERKKLCTQSASAVVTQVDKKTESYRSNGKRKHRTVYYASFQYEVNGQTYSGREKCSSSVSQGQTIGLSYNPDNPSQYILNSTVNSQGTLKTTAVVFKILGIVLAVIGLFMFVTGNHLGNRRFG